MDVLGSMLAPSRPTGRRLEDLDDGSVIEEAVDDDFVDEEEEELEDIEQCVYDIDLDGIIDDCELEVKEDCLVDYETDVLC